jgi:hypothetical protein
MQEGGTEPRKPSVHTVPNPQGRGWVNEVNSRPVSQHRTKEDAVERGREIAQRQRTEHVIHNTGGRIGRKNSPGGDPNAPKDKNR